jgi:hypothetical protein
MSDIQILAQYLKGTDNSFECALSELGFDPDEYDERKIRKQLRKETGLVQCQDTGIWRNKGIR